MAVPVVVWGLLMCVGQISRSCRLLRGRWRCWGMVESEWRSLLKLASSLWIRFHGLRRQWELISFQILFWATRLPARLGLGTGVTGFERQTAHYDHDNFCFGSRGRRCPEDVYCMYRYPISNARPSSPRNPPLPSSPSLHQTFPKTRLSKHSIPRTHHRHQRNHHH